MRSIIGRLFGASPYKPLQEHMRKAKECVACLPELLEAFLINDMEQLRDLSEKISRLEHEADEIKNAIRDHLPRGFLSPVHRGDFIALLKVLDRFPDTMEDLSIVMTLRNTVCPEFTHKMFRNYTEKTLTAFYMAADAIDMLETLVAATFSGPEYDRIKELIKQIGHTEWETDTLQHQLSRAIFKHEKELDVLTIQFLNSVIRYIGAIANHAESVGDRLRVLISS